MPKIESWDKLPAPVRQHLIERMRDRAISIADLNQLRLWIERCPKFRRATGSRTSAHSRSAVEDRFQKRRPSGQRRSGFLN
jgi:hypothetical protein